MTPPIRSAVLVPLLILGPLVTAVRGNASATALVALVAFVVAFLLGFADRNFFTTDHVIEMAAVLGGGVLAATAGRAREQPQDAGITTDLAAAEPAHVVRATVYAAR